MYSDQKAEDDRLEEDELIEKIPSKYKDLYDSEDFEKFNSKKEWWD
jgi:hypothetical protein